MSKIGFIEYILGYEVERKKVKNINLRIRSDLSVYISAPVNLDKYYIEQFIISKKDWIDKNIKKINEYSKNRVEEDYTDKSKIKFLGKVYTLEVKLSNFDKLIFKDGIFLLYTSNDDFEYKKKIIYTFYYNEANKIFKDRIENWKHIMRENFDRLIIKTIKGKWGYCNCYKKIIALNIELIKRSLFEIDYVCVHELAHLKHPNHSINFYRHVEKYMKNYKEAEKLLKYR